MTLSEFAKQIEESKSYDVTKIFISMIPDELYKNNSMNIPSTAERDLRNACKGKFASGKDEADFNELLALIAENKPIYPLTQVIRSKNVVGLTLISEGQELTLNIPELRAFAANKILGVIETAFIKIDAKAVNCVKGVYTYNERGGKIVSIYQQVSGMQIIPAMSASYINIIDNGHIQKIRISGTLTIPKLRVAPEYSKFIKNSERCVLI